MQFSKNWLYEWVNYKNPISELTHRLTMAGLEVDAVTPYQPFQGVVVGQLTSIEEHPKAKHLKICQLSVLDQTFQVVTAASEITIGDKVVYAPIGTHLPAIHQRKEVLAEVDFKGEKSQGMMLSATEMGLSEKSDGLLLLSDQAPVGEDVWEYLHLDDVIIDLDITPNRGDCLSIQGIAREIHALTKSKLNPIKIESIPAVHHETVNINLQAPKACSRYCGRIIKNVDCSRATPDWMVEKLRRSNIRVINPVVDILNFIMIELGQPMHAFDFETIDSDITVRMSQVGESLKLLDGQTATFDDNLTLLVADKNKALAIAGVMGGDGSAVTSESKTIFLESAFFAPEMIAGTGRKFNIHTDSSFRFERGVDPQGQIQAIERATQWILDICGGEPGPIVEVDSDSLPKKQPISFSLAHAQKLLGYELNLTEVVQDLRRLQCNVEVKEEECEVLAPSYRFDLNIQEDLIEEIARLKGYDNIELTLPKGICSPRRQTEFNEMRLKRAMVDLGYQEVISYSFVDKNLQTSVHGDLEEQIELSNPIASDMSVMRKSLWPGLLKACAYNMHRQQSDLSFFEVGLVFNLEDGELKQRKMLGGLCSGTLNKTHWSQKSVALDVFDLKGHIEQLWALSGKVVDNLEWPEVSHIALHPGQSANIVYSGAIIGAVGALHPRLAKSLDIKSPVFLFEMSCEWLQKIEAKTFQKPSSYPVMRRDLSFVVHENKTCEEISGWLKKEGGHLLKDVIVFDLYQGRGVPEAHKSMALGLIWQDSKRTLVDKEVDDIVDHLVQGIRDTFGAQLRD